MVVDNGSVFTKNLVEFLEKSKTKFSSRKPENIKQEDLKTYDSFILSGRRHNDRETNSKNSLIIKFVIQHNLPLLGICYGAEILSLTVGGTIKKMTALHKGSETVTIKEQNPLAANTISVYESHNYEISKLPPDLVSIGSSSKCKNEIIQLKNYNIFGTQFHPEMSDDGKELIRNFCRLQY